MVLLLARTASVEIMEAATRNAESPQSLPLFRAEAMAARQKIQGEALFIRPFSLSFFLLLLAAVAAISLGFLLLAKFEPRVSVTASVSESHVRAGNDGAPEIEAVFYVPETQALLIQPGSRVPVRCLHCGSTTFQRGTVTRVEPAPAQRNAKPADPGYSSATFRVTIVVTPFSPLPGTAQVQQSAKFEAEFPLKRRPLIQWLIGSAAW